MHLCDDLCIVNDLRSALVKALTVRSLGVQARRASAGIFFFSFFLVLFNLFHLVPRDLAPAFVDILVLAATSARHQGRAKLLRKCHRDSSDRYNISLKNVQPLEEAVKEKTLIVTLIYIVLMYARVHSYGLYINCVYVFVHEYVLSENIRIITDFRNA